MSRTLSSSPLFYCALILSLWLAFYDRQSEGLRITTSAQDDWSSIRGGGGRVFPVSGTTRLVYAATPTGTGPLLAVQVDTNQQCLPACPSYVLGNNTKLDYWVTTSAISKVFLRSGTSLLSVPWAGGAAIYYDTLTAGTNGQFFHLTNGANSRVLLRNSAGDINLFETSTGNLIETMNVTGSTDTFPTVATFNAPLIVRSSNFDIYWTQGTKTQVWYSFAGTGVATQVNFTTQTVTGINDNRQFTTNLKYYLIETTDGTTYSLWLINPADVATPIEVTTGLFSSVTGEFALTTGTPNWVVFAGMPNSTTTLLYRFKTNPLDSTATAVGNFASILDITLFAGSSSVVGLFVVDNNPTPVLSYTLDVAGTPSFVQVAAATVGANSVVTNFIGTSVRYVVLTDSTAPSQLELFNGATSVGVYTTAAKSFLISTLVSPNVDIVWLETTGSNPGLWKATSTSITPVQLTPSTLTTGQAATIKYVIASVGNGANQGAKVFYLQGNEIYSVPLSGCADWVSITTQPTQPTGASSCAGDPTSVSVVTNGVSGTVYQWQKFGSTWDDVASAGTSATFNPTVPSSGTDTYRVLVTADCGTLLTSSSVSVAPTASGSITTPPSFGSAICPGGTVTLTTVASSTPNTPTYQWSRNGATIGGATNYTYIFAAVPGNTGNYICKVQWFCNSITTSSVRVVINVATSITTHPANATVCSSVGSHTFSVSAVGTALTYQWYKNGTIIAGQTSSSLDVSSLTSLVNQVTYYHVVVTGTCGTLTSQTAWLTVLPSTTPVITNQPISKTVCPGSTVRFHVTATGEALNYAWNFNTIKLPSTLDYVNLTKVNSSWAGDYYCTVSTSTCTSISSSIVTLAVASTCTRATTIIITIAGQSAATFNATYRDATFIPAIIGALSEFGITVTAQDIVIVSVKDGSAIVEFGFSSANADAALQAILDIWQLELDYFVKYGMIAVKDVRSGSAVIITTTTTGATTNTNGGGGDGGSSNTGAIVGGVVGGILGFAVVCICIILLILLIVFIVLKGGFKVGGNKKWKQQNWWEEDDL